MWQGASTRGFSLRIDELFPFRLGELADQRVTKVTGRVWRRKIFQDSGSSVEVVDLSGSVSNAAAADT